MRFDSREHVDAFNNLKVFPAIHAGIHSMVERRAGDGPAAIDIGAGTGLISAYLAFKGIRACVLAVEPNKERAGLVPVIPGLHVLNAPVSPSSLPVMVEWVKAYHADLMVARRSIYEVDKANGREFLVGFGKAMVEAGIKKLVLQGCVPVKNPQVRLHTSELEAEAMMECGFLIRDKQGPVIYMEVL